MEVFKIIVTILEVLASIALIAVVLFQSGKEAGLSGAIGGVADSFLAKGQARTVDAKLARATKWIGAAFLVLTLVLLILNFFSAFASERLGLFLHYMLIIVSSPMICSGHWGLSLFLWACLLFATFIKPKKD